MIEIVGVREDLLRFLEADATERVRPQPLALARIEVKAHMYNSYTISSELRTHRSIVQAGRRRRDAFVM